MSIARVAKEAGVSIAAVSAVMGAAPSSTRVSPETRQRILAVARRMGYQPHPMAASFRRGRTYIIGMLSAHPEEWLLYPDGAVQFLATMRAAMSLGYRVSILSMDYPHLDPRLMDGCIIGIPQDDRERDVVRRLAAAIPVLTVAQRPVEGCVQLQVDAGRTRNGIWKLANHLFDLGHRDLLIMESESRNELSRTHVYFEEAARARGIHIALRILRDRWQDRGIRAIDEICGMSHAPKAVVAFNDESARLLIARLAQCGLRVPSDVSVATTQTIPDVFQVPPALTGLDRHFTELHEEIIRRFVAVIESGERSPIAFVAPEPDLIVRESCAPWPSP